MKLTEYSAMRIVRRLRMDGFTWCLVSHVWEVHNTGTILGDESLASAILHEFEEYGVEVPAA